MNKKRDKSTIEKARRQWSYWRLKPRVPTQSLLLLHVEPSGACNLHCLICPQSIVDKKPVREKLMSMDLFDKILSDAAGSVREMYFAAGGEPLLNPELPEMVRKAAATGLETTIHTNATLLTREKAVALIDAGLTRITLNIIDTKEEYEFVRQGASFERTIANIRMFLEVKQEMGREPYMTLQVVKPHHPGDDPTPRIAQELLDNFRGLPIDRTLCFWAHHFGGDFVETGKLKFDEPQRSEAYFPCQMIWMAMMVAYDGKVRPCCIDLQGTYTLGDIREQSLLELWNCAAMVRLRTELAAGRYQNPLCCNCQQLWHDEKKGGSPKAMLYNALFKLIAKKPQPVSGPHS